MRRSVGRSSVRGSLSPAKDLWTHSQLSPSYSLLRSSLSCRYRATVGLTHPGTPWCTPWHTKRRDVGTRGTGPRPTVRSNTNPTHVGNLVP